MNVGIYIYRNAEVLDFAGPFEVFSTGSWLSAPSNRFKVFLIAQDEAVVNARGGFQVLPHYSFKNHPDIDVLIVVGGVHSEEMHKTEVLERIANTVTSATLVSSVCTGVFLLAAAGVISTEQVTTHWDDIADLRAQFPLLGVKDNVRWLEQGRLVTSAGISAGIDMSLYLVSRLAGLDLASRTARPMDFDWSLQKT